MTTVLSTQYTDDAVFGGQVFRAPHLSMVVFTTGFWDRLAVPCWLRPLNYNSDWLVQMIQFNQKFGELLSLTAKSTFHMTPSLRSGDL